MTSRDAEEIADDDDVGVANRSRFSFMKRRGVRRPDGGGGRRGSAAGLRSIAFEFPSVSSGKFRLLDRVRIPDATAIARGCVVDCDWRGGVANLTVGCREKATPFPLPRIRRAIVDVISEAEAERGRKSVNSWQMNLRKKEKRVTMTNNKRSRELIYMEIRFLRSNPASHL